MDGWNAEKIGTGESQSDRSNGRRRADRAIIYQISVDSFAEAQFGSVQIGRREELGMRRQIVCRRIYAVRRTTTFVVQTTR